MVLQNEKRNVKSLSDMNELDRRERVSELVRIIKSDPGSHVYVELVELLIAGGEYRRAESILKRSRAIDPEHLPGRVLKVRLQYVQGEQERALKGIRSLLRRHPHHVDTILLYVDFLEDMADYDEAVQVLQKKLRYAEDPRFIDRLQQLTGDAAAQAERTMRRPRFENLDVPSARRARSDSNSSDGRSREPLPSSKQRTSGPSIRGPAEEPPTAESAIPITLMHALQQSADRSEGEETQQYVPESARPQSELNRVTSVTDVSGQE